LETYGNAKVQYKWCTRDRGPNSKLLKAIPDGLERLTASDMAASDLIDEIVTDLDAKPLKKKVSTMLLQLDISRKIAILEKR